ncbi:MAG: hypothetical protein JW951_09570 [Lentisphaerae bacterium]|nr:hypothetical protein [Lentisphaerota bacterium]
MTLPPADCVLRRKIETAKKLLSARDATVLKRYTGKTPTLFQASEG